MKYIRYQFVEYYIFIKKKDEHLQLLDGPEVQVDVHYYAIVQSK